MEFRKSIDILSPRKEAEILVEEFRVLREAQAKEALEAISRRWERRRLLRGSSEKRSLVAQVHTPSGWLMRNLIEKDYDLDKDLLAADFIERRGRPQVLYRWEFDHFTLTYLPQRTSVTAYNVLSVHANPDRQIICTFLSKKLEESQATQVDTDLLEEHEWKVGGNDLAPVEQVLDRLYDSNTFSS